MCVFLFNLAWFAAGGTEYETTIWGQWLPVPVSARVLYLPTNNSDVRIKKDRYLGDCRLSVFAVYGEYMQPRRSYIVIDEVSLLGEGKLRLMTCEQMKLLGDANGKIMYPFLEASGASLKNINKGIAAYLPKTTSTRKGAIALQLSDQATLASAFDDCNINVTTPSTVETTNDEQDNHDDQRDRVMQDALKLQESWAAGEEHGREQGRDARGPRSGSKMPLYNQQANNESYKVFKDGISVDRYRHNWHHAPETYTIDAQEQLVEIDQNASFHVEVYSERVMVTTLLGP